MQNRTIPISITQSLVEAHFQRKSLRLTFAPALENFFEHETGPERCRYLFRMSLIVLAVFQLALIPQRMLLGDEVFPKMLLVQWGITTPLALAIEWSLRWNPRPILREIGVVAVTLLAAGNCAFFTLLSHAPGRWAMLQFLCFAFLCITSIQQIRFLPTVLACAGLCLFELFVTSQLSQYGGGIFTACALITLMTSCFAAFGNYMTEKRTRDTFLISLMGRIQNEELNRASTYDALTSLGNRRLLREAIAEIETAPAKASYAVLMLDIDYFKNLNDQAGHLAGDQCLVRIASLIQSQLRSHNDHAFRYGGEEFVILLNRADHETALAVAERIRKAIEAAGIPNPGVSPAGPVTASVGVATGVVPIEVLLADADAALYAAKRTGRNKVCDSGCDHHDPGISWTGAEAHAEETASA